MDPLFKNSYVRDRQMAKELYRFFYFKRTIYIVCDIVLGLYFIHNLFLSIYYWEFLNLGLILPPLLYAFRVFMYCFNIKVLLKRDLEIHGKEPTLELTVTNEGVQHAIFGHSQFTLDFSKIKRAFCTKNYIFLHTKANLVCAFKKNGFSIGQEAEFIELLKSKGIRVRKNISPKLSSKLLSLLPPVAYAIMFALYFALATFDDKLDGAVWVILYMLLIAAEICSILGPVLSILGLLRSIQYRNEDRKKGTIFIIVSIISIIIGIAFSVIYFARFAESTYILRSLL